MATDAQRRAKARYIKNNVKQKQVAFYPGDRDLLEWAESRDEPFATYVKRLVREDMGRARK